MTTQTSRPREMSLGENFDVAVSVNGVRIEISAGGNILAYTNGDVRVFRVSNDDQKPANTGTPQIGDRMEDGTIYAGLSPDTNKPMYALPADAPLTMKWNAAMKYAAAFESHGHPKGTFRVPTVGELSVLFENRARIGGFNETGSIPAGWYWSSTEGRDGADSAWAQRFDGGYRGWYLKSNESSLRLVRS